MSTPTERMTLEHFLGLTNHTTWDLVILPGDRHVLAILLVLRVLIAADDVRAADWSAERAFHNARVLKRLSPFAGTWSLTGLSGTVFEASLLGYALGESARHRQAPLREGITTVQRGIAQRETLHRRARR